MLLLFEEDNIYYRMYTFQLGLSCCSFSIHIQLDWILMNEKKKEKEKQKQGKEESLVVTNTAFQTRLSRFLSAICSPKKRDITDYLEKLRDCLFIFH